VDKTELILFVSWPSRCLRVVARKLACPYSHSAHRRGCRSGSGPGLPEIHSNLTGFQFVSPPLLYQRRLHFVERFPDKPSVLLLCHFFGSLDDDRTGLLVHAVTGLPLAVVLFRGLDLAPDAVAALAVTKDLRVPRKIIVILEGESLSERRTSFISFRSRWPPC